MEGEEEGGGIRLSKRFSDKGGGEVDYKTKSGTAWSHSYLNQKPWHPLSYPNQRRKWIAEQIQAQHQRRTEEVSREYAQEQEFFRQAALVSKKDKEKIEMMKAVSFMYVRPPGYNAESAKAAEIADESVREHHNNTSFEDPQTQTQTDAPSTSRPQPPECMPPSGEEAKKPRLKDVFGRPLPTEQEFEILKNAPRMETGVPTRAKPFGVEVRNVKCVRCGAFGHQSGDRECPLKDAIMPNEEGRLKRDDPLTAILAHTDPSEPLKWELKQKPGISPPRGGFKPDDPNQQIVAEDIFDEYGGFLSGDVIPELLTNFSSQPRDKSKKKTKHKKKQSSPMSGEDGLSSSYEDDKRSKKKICKVNKKKHGHSESSPSEILEFDRHKVKSRDKHSYSFENSNNEKHQRSTKKRQKHSHSYEDSEICRHYKRDNSSDRCTNSFEDSEPDKHHRDVQRRRKHSFTVGDSYHEKHHRSRKVRQKHSHSYEDSKIDRHCRRDKSRESLNNSSEDSEPDRHLRSIKSRHRHSYSSEDSGTNRQNRNKKSRDRHSYSYVKTEDEKHHRSRNSRHKHSCI
ncbi:hypothetical protein PRUPE_1G353400 [Prunus persica]|uniref:CBF1-interacting co-repressor CIR N-terminal domain-containing protein n=1 Tax=Prunus persica TaxID=3760 RepID=A0A251R843_PRUPE|nr:uncharacterized zinc finger CCHC domain-containing protein At4g19190 [Prunus persica]ONI32192.1 hypothetical protein PRUPE_1G353400 [Prunus persica]